METAGNEAMRAPMFDGHAVLLERTAMAQGGAGAETGSLEGLKATATGRSKRGSSSTPTASFPPAQEGAMKKVDQRSTPTWIPHASASLGQPASLPSSQESGVTGSDISQWIGETQRSFASRLLHKPAGSGDAKSVATSATSSSSSGSSRWGTRTCPATPPHNTASAPGGVHHETSVAPVLTKPVAAAVAAVAAAARTLPSRSPMPAMRQQQQQEEVPQSPRSYTVPPLLPPTAPGVDIAVGEAAAVPAAATQAPRQSPATRQRDPSQRAQARQGGGCAAAGAAEASRVQTPHASSSFEGGAMPAAAAGPARRKATGRVHASVAATAMVAPAAAAAGDREAAVAPSSRGEKGGKVQGQGRPLSLTRNGAIKGPWTKEEDAIIVTLYESGVRKWAEIAEQIPGRVGKQCRERWFNHLDPEVKKTVWLPEEDRTLVTAQHAFGNSWTKIAKLLPGRSENAVKNRWNSAARRKAKAEADVSFPRAFGSGFDAHARWLSSDARAPTEDATAAVLAAVAAVEAREAEEREAGERYAALSPEEQALVPKPKPQPCRRKLPRGRKNPSAAPVSVLRRRGARSSSPQQKGLSAIRRRPADAGVEHDGAAAAAWAYGSSLPPPLTRPASAPQLPLPPVQPVIPGGRHSARYEGEAPVAPVARAGTVSSNKPLHYADKLAKARQLHSRRGQLQQGEERVLGVEEAVAGGYGVFDDFCGVAMTDSAGGLGIEMSGGLGSGVASHSHHGAMAMPVPIQMTSFLDTSGNSAAAAPCFLASLPSTAMGISSPCGHGHYFLHEPLAGGDGGCAHGGDSAAALLPPHLLSLGGFGGGGSSASAASSVSSSAAAAYQAGMGGGRGSGVAVGLSTTAASSACLDLGIDRPVAPGQAQGLCDGDADGSELLCSSITQDSAEDDMSLSIGFSALATGTLGHSVGGSGGGGCDDLTPAEMVLVLNQLDMGNLGNSTDGGVDQFFYDSAGGGAGGGTSTTPMQHSLSIANVHAHSMHSVHGGGAVGNLK